MLKSVFAALLLLGAGSTAFAKPIAGAYTLAFFNDPGHVSGTQICLTLTVSNGIVGFAKSGTFVDTDGFGIVGQYILDGTSLHLIMLTTGVGDNVDGIGPFAANKSTGKYDDFFSGYNGGSNTDVSSGTYTLTPGCTASARRLPSTRYSITR